MKPVALVIPGSCFLLDERVFPSLGVLKVAAVLEQAGHVVEVLDLSGVENYEEAVRAFAETTEATAIGITATTPQMPAVARIVRVFREVCPEVRLILGGPHVTLVNAAYRKEKRRGVKGRATFALETCIGLADVVVAGDGETAIFPALEPGASRLIDADDPAGALFLKSEDLDKLPLPARHLIDLDSYNYSIEGHRATPVVCQLGCPFACGFCGGRASPFLRRVRLRSTESVVGELRHLHETYGYTGYMLFDDELNVNPQMVPLMSAIAALQAELGAEFRLRGFVKAELFTEAQARAMHSAGFRWLLCGYESGSPRILRNINKKASREDNTRCLSIARAHGLKVKALMSLGHPGESAETIEDTRQWLLETAPDDFDTTIITTYPGTPYYDEAEQGPEGWTYAIHGDRLHAEDVDHTQTAEFYKGRPDDGYRSFVHTDHLSAAEIVTLRDDVEADVRAKLGIPFNPSRASVQFEHSMGQGLPPSVLRRTA